MTNKEIRNTFYDIVEKIQEVDISPFLTYSFSGVHHTLSWGDTVLFDTNDWVMENIITDQEIKNTIEQEILRVLKNNQSHISEIQKVMKEIIKEVMGE
jgi:hypothetical protein